MNPQERDPNRSDREDLVRKARSALDHAYAPYSGYRVGAALLTQGGRIYTGVNVENASYGLTVCAERVALFKAISEGETGFEALAVAAKHEEPPKPCGACLQVLAEFSENLPILLAGIGPAVLETTLTELLPHPFRTGTSRGD